MQVGRPTQLLPGTELLEVKIIIHTYTVCAESLVFNLSTVVDFLPGERPEKRSLHKVATLMCVCILVSQALLMCIVFFMIWKTFVGGMFAIVAILKTGCLLFFEVFLHI